MVRRPEVPSVGATLGSYRLERKLAVGGAAEVWAAEEHLPDGRPRLVALKIIQATLAEEPGFRALFEEEVGAAASLDHPNIVRVHRATELGGHLVQVMELLDGLDLRRALSVVARRRAQIPVGVVLAVGAQLASALAYAHGRSGPDGRRLDLVHRDVSPHNVMLTRSGQVKLLDFGLGRALERRIRKAGVPALDPQKVAYRSPEQALGVGVTAQSDIFSLGVVLWEMAAMQRLFRATNEAEVQALVVAASIPPIEKKRPELPAPVSGLIHQMLSQRASDRPATMAEVATVLAEAWAEAGHPDGTVSGLARWVSGLFGDPPKPEEVAVDTGPIANTPDITEPVPAPDFGEEETGSIPPEGQSGETPAGDPSGRTVAMAPLSTMAVPPPSAEGNPASATPYPTPTPSSSDAAPTMALAAPSLPPGSSSTPGPVTPSEGSRPAGFRLPTKSEIRRAIEEQPTMPVVADPRFASMVGQGTGARAPVPRVERLTPTADGPLVPPSSAPVPLAPSLQASEVPSEGDVPLSLHESSPDRLPAVPLSISAAPPTPAPRTSGPSRATIQWLVALTGALALLALALAVLLFLKD